MNFVLGGEVDAVLVLRDFIWNLDSTNNRGFISPTTRYISKGVSSAAEKQDRNIEFFEELSCGSMSSDG